MNTQEEARDALYNVGNYINQIVADNCTLLRINSQLNTKIMNLEKDIAQLKNELQELKEQYG